MDFTLENVKALTKEVKKTFNDAMSKPKQDYLEVATVITTKSHTVDYTWLGDLPAMRQWIEDRFLGKLKDYVYTISKIDWETSISVKRDDFLFDTLSLVKTKVLQMVHAVTSHYNKIVFGLIKLNGNCFDGTPFFGEHTVGEGDAAVVYKNITTAELTEDSLFAVIQSMQTIKDSEGESLDIEPNLLLVAPDLYKTAKKILTSKQLAGSDNVAEGLVKFKVVRQMDAGTWCVLDTSKPLKPFILQITKAGKTGTVQEDTADMFKKKLVHYGIDTMDNAGYGFWQMAYFSSGTGEVPAE